MKRAWLPLVGVAALLAACHDETTVPVSPTLTPGGPAFVSAGSSSSDWEQCANNGRSTTVPANPACEWIPSVLNSGKATYYEDESIPFRFAIHLVDLGPNKKPITFDQTKERTVTFTYGFAKANHGNYDFLTRYDITEGSPNDGVGGFSGVGGAQRANLCTADLAPTGPYCQSNGALRPEYDGANHTSFKITDPAAIFVAGAQGSLAAGASTTDNFQKAVNVALQRYLAKYAAKGVSDPIRIDMLGGTIISVEPVTYQVGQEVLATITIRFTAKQPDVLMAFGAHFSYVRDWKNIKDKNGVAYSGGAGQSGSPFHIKVDQIDGTSVGALGNNVSGDAVQPVPTGMISLTQSAANPVGQAHTITATVIVDKDDGNGPQPVSGTLVTFTKDPVNSTTGDFVNGVNTCTTGASGACSVSILSATPGKMIVNVSATVGQLNLTTVTGTGSNGPLTKVWADANITIAKSAVNPIGQTHIFTITVKANDGSGTGTLFQAVSGLHPTVTFSPAAPGTVVDNCKLGATGTDANGVCTVEINSIVAGTFTANASVTLTVMTSQGNVSLTRDTDPLTSTPAGDGGSGPATKIYANAGITIDKSAVNEVGQKHIFTITVKADDGSGMKAVQGNHPTVTFSPAVPGTVIDNCKVGATGTDASGVCTVEINSTVAGVFTANATTSVVVQTNQGPTTFQLSTNQDAGGLGDATKRYVDGTIALSPLTAANPVNTDHEVFASVKQDDGLPAGATGGDAVSGLGSVPNGTTVTFSLLNNTAGATFVSGNTCTTTSGSCSIKIHSNSAGGVDIHATATFTVGGVPLTRATGSSVGSSADAHKDYLAARISILPSAVNEVGKPHTFTAKVEQSADSKTYTPVSGLTVTFTKDQSSTTGSFVSGTTCNTSVTGECTIDVTSSATGKMVVTASATITFGTTPLTVSTNGSGGSSGPATKRWVQAKLLLTPQTDENLIGTPHVLKATLQFDLGDGSGFVGAGATQTINLSIASGVGSLSASSCITDATSSCTVTLTYATAAAATTMVHAAWSGTISATEGSASASAATGTGASDKDARKDWVLGSISVTKTIEYGPFTTAVKVCFTLTQTAGGTYTTQLCKDPMPASGTFQFGNLMAGTYKLEETVPAPYTAVAAITGIVVDDAHRDVSAPAQSNPLPPGALKIQKLLSGSTFSSSEQFTFSVEKCAAGSTASTCNSPVAVSGSPFTISSANNPLTVSNLVEAYYQVTETNSAGYTVNPATSQIVKVVAGSTAGQNTVTFNNVPAGRGLMAPTQTTCEQFAGGSTIAEPALSVGLKGSTINNVAPGVVFYYATLPVQSSSSTMSVLVRQRNAAANSTALPYIDISQGQAYVLRYAGGTCTQVASFNGQFTTSSNNPPTVSSTSFTAQAGVQYIVQIKLNPNSIVGQSVDRKQFPGTYTFDTSLGGLGGPFISSGSVPMTLK